MARTLVFSAGLGVLIAWNWARLEQPRPSVGPLMLMVALGIAPALLPSQRLRFRPQVALLFAAEAAAVITAAAIALHVHRPYHLGRLADRAGSGFVDFYDVLVPFNGAAHPLMHGVLLLAVCIFSLLCALAVAARRPLAAILGLAAGAGWPATILPGSDDLGRGAFLLVAALALVAWLRPESRRAPPQILAGTALVVLALIVSSSGSVARGQFIGWQNWDLYTKPGKRVSVEFVWRSNYDGVRFPKKRTRVFTVRAPDHSVYWRATTLDAFSHDVWDEDLLGASPIAVTNPIVDLSGDPLVPVAGRDPSRWTRVGVTIDALRESHLVGPSQPVAYDMRSIGDVEYEQGGVALAPKPLPRGARYTVWGYNLAPKPAELAESPPDYPGLISSDRRFLTVGEGAAVPPFGTAEHDAWIDAYFRSDGEGLRYQPLYRAARGVAGNAKNPYAATVALEAWFRSSGGFTYDEQPPARTPGVPALVQFVTQTKRGYCQHFAGAMALMLRYLGIPARVAAGFTSGNYDSRRGIWTVYDRNAHTWVEVWFKGYGWLPFDPTPGRGTLGASYTSSSVSFDANGAKAVLVDSALKAQKLLGPELSQLGRDGRARSEKSKASTPDRGSPGRANPGRGTGAGGLVALAVAILALLFVLAKLALRRSRFFTSDPRLLASACRRELVDFLLDQGIEVPRNVGPRELGRLLRKRVGIDASDFAEALGLARFGPEASAAAAAREARRELQSVRRSLRRTFPIGRRARGLFSPRSLLAGR
jgi:transglutaminase-like putative cysteine protease